MQKTLNKYIDISGFGHSGKSTVTDLLKEFEGFNVPHTNFEFNLLRIQGGLIDLKFALVDNWSPIRSDAAIRRFKRLINRIGTKASVKSPKSLWMANGMNYDAYFNNKFIEISNEYIDSLIHFKFIGEWPYQIIEEPPIKQFQQRIQTSIKLKNQHLTTINVTSIQNKEFIEKTRDYLDNLFACILTNEKKFVLHNAFEPYNPSNGMQLFTNAKLIVVQRDPRDIYASAVGINGFVPEFEIKSHWLLKQSMLSTNDIHKFCERQSVYYNQVKDYKNDDILRLRYEDIILKYDETLKIIYSFLGEEDSIHTKKREFFKPDLSAKNIGVWKKSKNQDEIRVIENLLSDYIYES